MDKLTTPQKKWGQEMGSAYSDSHFPIVSAIMRRFIKIFGLLAAGVHELHVHTMSGLPTPPSMAYTSGRE